MKIFRRLHPSWCFYALVLGIIFGTIISLCFNLSYFSSPLWLLVVIIILTIAVFRPFRIMLIICFLAGIIIANFRVTPVISSTRLINNYLNQTVTITGRVTSDPDPTSTSPVIYLTNIELVTGESNLPLSGTLYVKLSRQINYQRSDYLTLRGQLRAGFGTFLGSISRPEVLSIDHIKFGDIFADFKTLFANQVKSHLDSPQSDLGLGYLMGMKSGLPADLSENLRAVGMTHVVVASGAHLAILVSLIKRSFGRISRFAGLLGSLLMIFAFASVVGFTPSMTRAALVATLSILVGLTGRRFTPLRLLGLVAAITLLIDPTNFLNLGWQLSFASFFGILILAPRLQKSLYGGKTPPWLASMLITSLSTSLICTPILIYNFGSFSLLSFVANLIILPTLPYAMLTTFLVGATSFWPFLTNIFSFLANILLNLHIALINFLSTKTIFIVKFAEPSPLIFLLYFFVIIFLIWPFLHQHLVKVGKLCYNKTMKIKSEAEMLQFGTKVAQNLQVPAVIELIGDVGAGKTTFTRGLASGLGISDSITSPSFTISKRYTFASPDQQPCELIHYDFYRLNDPGIMRDELSEAIAESNSIVVVEWGDDVADLLPKKHLRLEFAVQADGSREVKVNQELFL